MLGRVMQIIALLGVLALAAYWAVGGLSGIDRLFDRREAVSVSQEADENLLHQRRGAQRDHLGSIAGGAACDEPARSSGPKAEPSGDSSKVESRQPCR